MNLLPAALLSESHFSQNRGQDHSRTMNPGQRFVQSDWTARLGAGDLGRANRKVSSRGIQSYRCHAQSGMQVTAGAAGLPSPGERGTDKRGGEGSNRYQSETLMDLEHVRPPIKECLSLGIALGLVRSDAEILQRRLLRVRACAQITCALLIATG